MKERIQQLLSMLDSDDYPSSEKTFACVEYDILCLWCKYRDAKDDDTRKDTIDKLYRISTAMDAILSGERYLD